MGRPTSTPNAAGTPAPGPDPRDNSHGDRLSRFSEACLRISESLDLNTVLQGVIDSARTLTGARYGALLTFDGSGAMEDLLTSGITPEERRKLRELPKGLGILGYLSEIEEPLRLADISAHARSVGFPHDHPPMKTFLGSPIRYRGERLGNIYLTEKEGNREFSRADEDILVMFASQAALVVANARRHRQEWQARADLEALLNISPVAVLVFDGKTGDLVSVNDETRRIIGKLHTSGPALSQILEVISLRTPDGREIPFDELPNIRAMRKDETVLADEVVVHLPDGRAVSTLVNARPIHGEDGEIVSVVTTMQDITPLEKMKSQRAELLGRVTRELQMPLTYVKGAAASVLHSPHPPDHAETRQLMRVVDEQADQMRQLISNLADMTRIDTGTLSLDLEATDLGEPVRQASETFLRQGTADRIELDLAPGLPRVMADRRRILQVLGTCLRTASEHSPEPSAIRVRALAEDPYVAVSVETAGGPIPGGPRGASGGLRASRNGESMDLAVCQGIIEAHGGRMSAHTPGGGLDVRISFTLPALDEAAHGDGSGPASPAASLPNPNQDQEQARILVADGEPEALRYMRNTLSEAGFTPVLTGNSDEVERLIGEERPHLVLVDPAMPRGEGPGLMERIRQVSDAPVIFVSGHGSGRNMERAFELGAADYVVKPFTPTELAARVRAALRKLAPPEQPRPPGSFLLGDLDIDYDRRLVTVAGRAVQLTATEYRLLFELSAAAGHVVTYEQLLRRAWGPLYSTDVRVVHTYIKQLRGKLGEDARNPRYIFTEPRVGYRMAGPEHPPAAG